MDYHPRVMRKVERKIGNRAFLREEPSARIVYVDRRGSVQMRWRDEVGTPDLWGQPGTPPTKAGASPSAGPQHGREEWLQPRR